MSNRTKGYQNTGHGNVETSPTVFISVNSAEESVGSSGAL